MNKRILEAYGQRYGNRQRKDRREGQEQQNDGRLVSKPSILQSAYNTWSSLHTWREDIQRNERFVYGDQWGDRVWDAKKCAYVTERKLLIEQGLQPSQYNIIRNILRTIVGFWSNNKTIPNCVAQKDDNQQESEVLTATLHSLYRKEQLWKFDINQLNQLLISGISVSKSIYTHREGESDVYTDYIDPFAFFVDNSMRDPRYRDCTFVGCFYDLPTEDIASMFAEGDKEREKEIKNAYGYSDLGDNERLMQVVETFTEERVDMDFFVPLQEKYGLSRLYEVWRKESADCFVIYDYLNGQTYNDFESTEQDLKDLYQQRYQEQLQAGVSEEDMLLIEWEWKRDSYWKYYYLTPMGDVLSEGINPYWHEKHPFSFEFHEFYIGKIYPFVADLIDANKQINKLSAISELLVKYSAKSLLFIPNQYIDNTEGGREEVEQKMTDYDAVISYDAKAGMPPPQYVNTVAQAFTPLNVVNMYLKLSEEVGGVYGALQGQTPPAGTPAQSFLQQSQNSATSLVGLFETINSYRTQRDKLNVQLIQQYYKGEKYVYDKDKGKHLLYEPSKVKNVDFEIAVVENTNTPAYRLMLNDVLMQLKQYDVNNLIDLRGLIEVGKFPFKEDLLDYLNQREQEMAKIQQGQGGAVSPMPNELQEKLGGMQFSPELQEQLSQLPPSVQEYAVQQAQKGQ